MKTKLMMLMAAIVVGLSACKDDAPSGKTCDQLGTVRSVACGPGVWQNLWIQLDNGSWLQPWESDINTPVQQGDRIKFGYTKVNRDRRYDGQVICNAMPPPADAVRIGCLKIVKREEPQPCDMEGTLYDYRKLDGCSWVIEAANGKKYEVRHFLDKSFVPADGQQISFSVLPADQVSICMVGERVDVSCIRAHDCSDRGTLHYNTKCQAWVIRSNGNNYEVQSLQKDFTEGAEILFSYRVLQTFTATCTTYPAVELTCYQRAK